MRASHPKGSKTCWVRWGVTRTHRVHRPLITEGECFPAGTLLRMADGSQRPIEDVRTLDEAVTAEARAGRVVQMASHTYDLLTRPTNLFSIRLGFLMAGSVWYPAVFGSSSGARLPV